MSGEWTAPQHPGSRTMPAPSTARKSGMARLLWDDALPHAGTVVDRYLTGRGLPGVQSAALRFHPAAPHPSGGRLPTMIAAVRTTTTGELQAIHRTYLRADGSGKATVEPAKASLGPVAGGAVLLDDARIGAALVIGEGIESTLSAARLIGGTAWCAISAGNLATLPLPPLPACPSVVIAADADAPGQRDAATAARRWHAEGRQVRIATPDSPDADFNDLVRARMAARESNHG
jgi:putative DNA primase/helicase